MGPINAELFAREKGNVAMLLALLEDEPVGVTDFYVRYHTLQLLTALAVSSHRLLEVRHGLPDQALPLYICLPIATCRFPLTSCSAPKAKGIVAPGPRGLTKPRIADATLP